ncbi:MAG: PaaI family thioesterase [Chloroflexi bacterium]|nr:PaaI family thioesterase [Chloroflexota bacterium]
MDNPIGLNLDFEFDGNELRARFIPQEDHQGYPGTVHGGIISSLLYELMANVPHHIGDKAVLRNSAVEFLRPTPVGVPLFVSAKVAGITERGFRLTANLLDESGRLLASATGEAVRPR